MNNFTGQRPEVLFGGELTWLGIHDKRLGAFASLSEKQRREATTDWSSILTEESARGRVFGAHLLRQILARNAEAIEEAQLEQEAVKLSFLPDRFHEWLPTGQIDNAWLGERYGSVGNWCLVGVGEHIVLSGFAKQFLAPTPMYGLQRLSAVSMHVRPFVPEVAEQIACAVQRIED